MFDVSHHIWSGVNYGRLYWRLFSSGHRPRTLRPFMGKSLVKSALHRGTAGEQKVSEVVIDDPPTPLRKFLRTEIRPQSHGCRMGTR